MPYNIWPYLYFTRIFSTNPLPNVYLHKRKNMFIAKLKKKSKKSFK